MVLLIFECAVLNAVSQKLMGLNNHMPPFFRDRSLLCHPVLAGKYCSFRQRLVLFDHSLGVNNVLGVCYLTYMYTKSKR